MAGLDEKESGTGDTREEEKRSSQNDVQSPDRGEEETHTMSVKPAELRECISEAELGILMKVV